MFVFSCGAEGKEIPSALEKIFDQILSSFKFVE